MGALFISLGCCQKPWWTKWANDLYIIDICSYEGKPINLDYTLLQCLGSQYTTIMIEWDGMDDGNCIFSWTCVGLEILVFFR